MSIARRRPSPPLQRIVSSSASVTAYGQPRRRATRRMARSEYPARPAWQNGIGSWIDPIFISIKHEHRTFNFGLVFPDRCQTAEQCHPERYSAKDLASAVEARSFASTLRMTRPFSSEHHCGYMSRAFNIEHPTLNEFSHAPDPATFSPALPHTVHTP